VLLGLSRALRLGGTLLSLGRLLRLSGVLLSLSRALRLGRTLLSLCTMQLTLCAGARLRNIGFGLRDLTLRRETVSLG